MTLCVGVKRSGEAKDQHLFIFVLIQTTGYAPGLGVEGPDLLRDLMSSRTSCVEGSEGYEGNYMYEPCYAVL